MKKITNLAIDENGYPIPRSEICFKCKKSFWLKFVVPRKNYSLKNNWGYFTGKVEDENKWIDITYQSSEQSRQENESQIKEFINETLPNLPQSRTLFLDECSFRLNEAPRRGYCPLGTRLFAQRPGNKGKNYTFIFLAQIANGKKVIHSRLIEGGMKSKEFHEFLSDLELPSSDKYYLLMDNLSVHKAKDSCKKLKLSTIRELLVSKNIEPVYLPPYTPELNPVEKCFNITRQYIEKCRPRIKEKLEAFLKEKLEFFHKEDLTKYLENSIQECLAKLSTENRLETSFSQKATNFVLEGLEWIKEVRPNLDINLAWGFMRQRLLEDIYGH